MQDLYKGFRKTAEDDHSATLEHDNGHYLTIAKSGLSKKQKHALSKLPLHQAKGTQVINEPQDAGTQAKVVGANIADAVANKILEGATEVSTPAQEPQLKPEQIAAMPEPNAMDVATGQPVFKRAPEFVQGEGLTPEEVLRIRQQGDEVRSPERLASEVSLKQNPLAFTPQIPQETQPSLAEAAPEAQRVPAETPAPTLAPAAPAVTAPQQPLVPQAQPALSDDERFSQSILNPNVPPSQKYQAFLERAMKKQQERDEFDRKFYEDMQKEEIKPVDVFHNKSTLGKIGSVIAMALSGIGAGITGKENMAMQVLNDQIAREIDAQKRGQERKFNLHKFHSEQLGSSAAADLQLANDMMNVAKMQIDEQINGWGNNPIMRQRAEAQKLALEAQMAENRAKIAESQTNADVKKLLMGQGAVPGGVSKQKPAALLDMVKGDAAVKAEATKEIEKRESVAKNAPIAMAALDKALVDLGKNKNFVTGLGTWAWSKIDPPQSLKDFRSSIRGMVPDIAGTNKDAVVKAILEDIEPTPAEVYKGEADQVRNRVMNWFQQQSSTPNLDRLGLDPQAFESTEINPEFWGNQPMEVIEIKTGNKMVGNPQQVKQAIRSGRYRLVK